jgi:hypothetical protein
LLTLCLGWWNWIQKSLNYSCISKRAKELGVSIRFPSCGTIRHLAIDSTGLKVFGKGEWKVKKHGADKRRTWRKLHLAVDSESHKIMGPSCRLIACLMVKYCRHCSKNNGIM